MRRSETEWYETKFSIVLSHSVSPPLCDYRMSTMTMRQKLRRHEHREWKNRPRMDYTQPDLRNESVVGNHQSWKDGEIEGNTVYPLYDNSLTPSVA